MMVHSCEEGLIKRVNVILSSAVTQGHAKSTPIYSSIDIHSQPSKGHIHHCSPIRVWCPALFNCCSHFEVYKAGCLILQQRQNILWSDVCMQHTSSVDVGECPFTHSHPFRCDFVCRKRAVATFHQNRSFSIKEFKHTRNRPALLKECDGVSFIGVEMVASNVKCLDGKWCCHWVG